MDPAALYLRSPGLSALSLKLLCFKCVDAFPAHMSVPVEARRGHHLPRIGVKGGCEPLPNC